MIHLSLPLLHLRQDDGMHCWMMQRLLLYSVVRVRTPSIQTFQLFAHAAWTAA